MLDAGERILLTLWVGAMWIVGYLVTPTLFNMLEKSVAGNVAGQLFTLASYIGLFCGGLLLTGVLSRRGKQSIHYWVFWVLVVMLLIIFISQFIVYPMIIELKATGIADMNNAKFGRLHGTASVLFLINSLLGLALVAVGFRATGQ